MRAVRRARNSRAASTCQEFRHDNFIGWTGRQVWLPVVETRGFESHTAGGRLYWVARDRCRRRPLRNSKGNAGMDTVLQPLNAALAELGIVELRLVETAAVLAVLILLR